jgi:large subunit ribosomal protein L10
MRAEKQNISAEYLKRINSSPFFIVVDYQGLKVAPITELRRRLGKAGAELHVVKNSIFRIAVKEAGLADLSGSLAGQIAVVTGRQDVSSAAKVLKNFAAEFEKPKLKFGYLKDQRLEGQQLLALADLPSIEVLRSKLLGLLNTPATQLARILNIPATQLARVIKAKAEKGGPEKLAEP